MLDVVTPPVAQPPVAPQVVQPVVPPTDGTVVQPVVPPAVVEPVVQQVADTVVEPVKKPSSADVDALTQFLVEAGLNVEEVVATVTANDGSPSLAQMKALIEKHGEGVANLLAAQMKQLDAGVKAKAAKNDSEVYKQVEAAFEGVTTQTGKETWVELAGWAKDNVDVQTRKEINTLLAAGGLQAKLAVEHLVGLFKGRQNTDLQPAVLLDGDGVSESSGVTPIDKATYTRELNKLLDAGHEYGTSPEIKKLDARRLKGLARNL